RRDYKDRELVLARPVAQGDRPGLILADGFQNLPKGGVNDPIDNKQSDEDDRENHPIEGKVGSQIKQAKELAPRDCLDTILAPGEFGLKRKEVNHLTKGQGYHREIDALTADRKSTRLNSSHVK